MKHFVLFACVAVGLIFAGCRNRQEPPVPVVVQEAEPKDTAVLEFPHPKEKQLTAADISLTKELLYDQYTLEDSYPYKDTVRSFKWDVIRNCLAYIENMQRDTTARWVVLQNYKNLNKEAPLVRKFVRNVYRRVSDTLVRKVAKLDHDAAMHAFSKFINDESLNAKQIAFVQKVIHYIEQNGYVESKAVLMKPPFDQPILFTRLFDGKMGGELMETINSVKENATHVTA